jgi:hypothetical protein
LEAGVTQLSTWGRAWGQAWGDSWGKLEESSQGKSGVQRLWMYELYAQSIEEDHKKRGLIKDEAKPTVTAKPAPVKAKPARTKPRKRTQEQKPLGKPLPVFARTQPAVFTYSANEAILQTQLDDVIKAVVNSPLPKFISVKPHRKVVEQQEIVQRENEDEEEFLLLAA